MPFKKIGENKYVSPRGNTFTRSQVALYYAQGGRFPGQKMGEMAPANPMKETNYGQAKKQRSY